VHSSAINREDIKIGNVLAVQGDVALKYVRVVIEIINDAYTYVYIGYMGSADRINYFTDGAQIHRTKMYPGESYAKLTNLRLPIKLKGSIITNLFQKR